MEKYSIAKTAYKTVEPPIFVLLAAAAAVKFLDLPADTAQVTAIALFGLWCGIRNAIKHKKWKR